MKIWRVTFYDNDDWWFLFVLLRNYLRFYFYAFGSENERLNNIKKYIELTKVCLEMYFIIQNGLRSFLK